MKKRVAYQSFPRNLFPIKVELIDYDTDEVLWTETVEGAAALHIPSFRPKVVKNRVPFGDGTVQETPPLFDCPRCGQRSHNIEDVRAGYCGTCRDWTMDQ